MRQVFGLFSISFMLVLVSLACADYEAMALRYDAEKAYHEAERHLRTLDSPSQSARISGRQAAREGFKHSMLLSIDALSTVSAGDHPAERLELQQLAFQSANRLSDLYAGERMHDTCLGLLELLLDRAELTGQRLMTAQYRYGQALQTAGQWDSALAVYDAVVAGYFPPLDDSGGVISDLAGLPLHLYRICAIVSSAKCAEARLGKAEEYYLSLLSTPDNAVLAAAAHSYLARLYDNAGRFGDALAQLRLLATQDSTQDILAATAIGDIYANRLGQPDSAVLVYGSLLDHISIQDTANRPRIRLKTALALIGREEHDRARAILIDLKRNFADFYSGTPLVQQTIARSFELQGNWRRAEAEYRFLIEKHRESDEAIAACLHLADHVAAMGRHKEAEHWLTLATEQVREMALRGAGGRLEARARYRQADMALRQDEPVRAVEILIELFDQFHGTARRQQALLRAAAICRDELDRRDRADSLETVWRNSQATVDPLPGPGILLEPGV